MVITQSGSVQEALYNQYINGACKEFKLVANMTDGYLAVAEGKADVCICSTASRPAVRRCQRRHVHPRLPL